MVGSQKQLEAKYAQATDTADQWYRRAELALQKGDDELAREALKRRKAYEVTPLACTQCVKRASAQALKRRSDVACATTVRQLIRLALCLVCGLPVLHGILKPAQICPGAVLAPEVASPTQPERARSSVSTRCSYKRSLFTSTASWKHPCAVVHPAGQGRAPEWTAQYSPAACELQDNAKTMKVQLDAQNKAVDQLKGNTRMLESKLAEAKSKKDTLKARAKSAATSKQIQEMIQGLNTSNAATAFERMEEKVMALEGESEAAMQAGHLCAAGSVH